VSKARHLVLPVFLAAIAPISAQITPQQTAAIRAAKTARISVVVRNDGKPTERDNSAAPWSSPVAYESFLRDMISLAGLTQGGDLTIAVSVDGKARAVEYRDRFSGAPMYAYLAGSLKGTITFTPAESPALVVKFDGKAPRAPEKITVGGGGDSGPTSSPARTFPGMPATHGLSLRCPHHARCSMQALSARSIMS
jgi:hypothetical protein